MREIKVKDIVNITKAKLVNGNEEETLDSFKKDTREIKARRYICRDKRRKGRW